MRMMKKLVAVLLAITLFLVGFSALAETQPAASINHELLAALLEQYDHQEIYFPSVSELYSYQGVEVNPGRDYSFAVKNYYGISAFIESISVIPRRAKPEEVVCSPYYATLAKNQRDPFVVNQETARWLEENYRNSPVEIVVNQTDYLCHYNEFGMIEHGLYQGKPAVFGYWQYIVEVDGKKSYGDWMELLVQVSDDVLVSVMIRPLYGEIFLENLADELTGLDFVRLGDANRNGNVDAVDALATLKHAVQMEEITDPTAFLMADCDQNLKLDAVDALKTLCIAVGK